MGEMRRYCFVTNPAPHIPHVQETNKGEWVRVSDHERVVAEKDARIKKLEVERLKDAQFVESARDLRWRQAIEALGADRNPDWTDEENRAYAAGLRAALNALDPEPLWQEATNE